MEEATPTQMVKGFTRQPAGQARSAELAERSPERTTCGGYGGTPRDEDVSFEVGAGRRTSLMDRTVEEDNHLRALLARLRPIGGPSRYRGQSATVPKTEALSRFSGVRLEVL